MNKPVEYVATDTFMEEYDTGFILGITSLARALWNKLPVDMLVFDNGDIHGTVEVTAQGYLPGKTTLIDEVIYTMMFPTKIRKFWIKYDDYGTHWIGTLLFPEDY